MTHSLHNDLLHALLRAGLITPAEYHALRS